MYRRFAMQLFIGNMVMLMSFVCVKRVQLNRIAATPAFQLTLEEQAMPRAKHFFGWVREMASGQRVVDYNVLVRERVYQISEEDYEILTRIVEAEAGCEDSKGKMLVAGVILNRVQNEKFPDTVKEVVFQQEHGVSQFSPVGNGRYETVTVSQETIDAVERVLCGEDVTEGALYFAARAYAEPDKMKWFDESLTRLFAYGGHEFFF